MYTHQLFPNAKQEKMTQKQYIDYYNYLILITNYVGRAAHKHIFLDPNYSRDRRGIFKKWTTS